MNSHAKKIDEAVSLSLMKTDPHSPAIKVDGRHGVIVKAGTVFGAKTFHQDTPIPTTDADLVPGRDYAIVVDGLDVLVRELVGLPLASGIFGGFHYAPGGNAAERKGGDNVPAINPCSLWDLSFRPACPDPRGMALVANAGRPFWSDIYLTAADCIDDGKVQRGTSRFGAVIADGDDLPVDPSTGKTFSRFDYAAACALMKHHGKGLLSFEEFAAAAIGVTEKTATERNPKVTGLDAARTSRFGLMQATGNMWVWGHDGDPDEPRAAVFGGSWISGGHAGARFASVACDWPVNSVGNLGARGRSDHLQLV